MVIGWGSNHSTCADSASANSVSLTATIAMSCLGRCAEGVPNKWRATRTEIQAHISHTKSLKDESVSVREQVPLIGKSVPVDL